MNPDVLQFINRMVDIPAACRSWYAQCTLCSRPCSGDGCHAPVVVQRQVPWLGRAENCGDPQLPFFWGSRNAWFDYGYMICIIQGGFWVIFYDFLRDWVDSAPEVDSRRSLHTWPMRKWPSSSSTVAWLAFYWFLLVMHLALCSR